MDAMNYDTVAATLAAAIIAKEPGNSAPTPKQAVELFKVVRAILVDANKLGGPSARTAQLP